MLIAGYFRECQINYAFLIHLFEPGTHATVMIPHGPCLTEEVQVLMLKVGPSDLSTWNCFALLSAVAVSNLPQRAENFGSSMGGDIM